LSKKCIVIGCGSHASSIISIVESSVDHYEIVGLVDVAEHYDTSEEKSGYNIILSLCELLNYSEKYLDLNCIIAIGDNIKRQVVFDQLISRKFKLPNIISSRAFVDRTVVMGYGNVISHGSVVNAQVKLGDNNLINTCVVVEHHCCIKNHTHIAPKALLCGRVNLNNLVFVGAGAIIIPNLCVDEEVVIGAGAVLTVNITEKKSTFIGVPAKVKIK